MALVLFQMVEFKTIKVFDRRMVRYCSQGPDGGRKTSEEGRAPSRGLRVILYLRTGTDSAQPMRVVQDSCIKG